MYEYFDFIERVKIFKGEVSMRNDNFKNCGVPYSRRV